VGAWGLRPRQAWGWGCAAVGGGNPNPLLALSERLTAKQELICICQLLPYVLDLFANRKMLPEPSRGADL